MKIYHLTTIRKQVGRLAICLLIVLMILCSAYLLYPPLRARYLVRELKNLHIDHSTFKDAQRFASKVGAMPVDVGFYPHSCNQTHCYWQVTVSNLHLPQWWRGYAVTLAITFEVKDSLVIGKGVWYDIDVDSSLYPLPPVGVSVGIKDTWLGQIRENWLRSHPDKVFDVVEKPVDKQWSVNRLYSKPVFRKFTVNMTLKSQPDDWKYYTAFNYRCFWKYKGCTNARELLPAADPFPEDK